MSQPHFLLGQTAPDFSVTAVIGGEQQKVTLSSYRGRYVVLVFFPLAFSPLCSEQIPEYSLLQDDFLERNAAVLGISRDNPYSLRAWAERYGLELPLLSDMNLEVARAYGVEVPGQGFAGRATFLIDPDGKVLSAHCETQPQSYTLKPETLLESLPPSR